MAPDVEPKVLADRIANIHNFGVIEANANQVAALQARTSKNEGVITTKPLSDEAEDGENGIGNAAYLKLQKVFEGIEAVKMQHPILVTMEGKHHYERLMIQAKAHRLRNQLGPTGRSSRTPILTSLGKRLVTLGEWLQVGDSVSSQKLLTH